MIYCTVIAKNVANTVFNKEIYYDLEASLAEISLSTVDELAKLEPFGAKNPYPVIRINRGFIRNLRRLNKGHIKGELETREGAISFIGFRMNIADEVAHVPIDVLGVLEKNVWNEKTSLQMRLVDFRPT